MPLVTCCVCVQLLEFYLYIGERNENHFIVATQDAELQSKLRDIPGQSFAKNCKCVLLCMCCFVAMASICTVMQQE